MHRLTLLAPLLALACAPTEGADVDAASLDAAARVLPSLAVVGGCSDVFAYGASADDTKAIFVHIDGGYAAEASQTGQPLQLSFTLPHPEVTVTAQWGDDLTINECNDVMMGQPFVQGEAVGVSGTVHLTLDPLGPYYPWDMSNHAVIELDGLRLEDPDTGRQRSLSTTLETTVGWLPG